MKRIGEIGIVIAMACSMVGCMSDGGALVVGPFSAMSAKHIDKAKMSRSVAASSVIPAEKRAAVIKAVNMSMSPNEIAVGYQVDVLSLFTSEYTIPELGLQALAATVDLAGEAAAGWALYDAFKTDRHDSGTVTITGNNNAVNYLEGTGNTVSGATTSSDHNNVPGGDYNDN